MDISIVIVTWNSEKFISPCLESIFNSSPNLDFEVLVVDNNSSDNTLPLVKDNFPTVKIIENPENLGYAKANNQGINESKGEYVLLLNPDTQLFPETLRLLFDFMEKNQKAGAVGPQMLNFDQTIQSSCREFPTFWILFCEFGFLARIFPQSRLFGKWRMGYFDHQKEREVDQPMGSALFLRKEALNQVGLLDESFPIFFNDVDLCFRLKKSGWEIRFYPEAKVSHFRGASTKEVKPKMIWASHLAFYRFLKKYRKNWFDRFLLAFFLPLLFGGSLIRILYHSIFKKKISPVVSNATPDPQ
jgi:GT2 family glycosyltransferase